MCGAKCGVTPPTDTVSQPNCTRSGVPLSYWTKYNLLKSSCAQERVRHSPACPDTDHLKYAVLHTKTCSPRRGRVGLSHRHTGVQVCPPNHRMVEMLCCTFPTRTQVPLATHWHHLGELPYSLTGRRRYLQRHSRAPSPPPLRNKSVSSPCGDRRRRRTHWAF